MLKNLGLLAVIATSATGRCHDDQAAACFESDAGVAWMTGDVGNADAGSHRPHGAGFELCSKSNGFDSSEDSYHFVGQASSGDFTLIADVRPNDSGEAGLAFTPAVGADAGARVRLTLRSSTPGNVVVSAAVRATPLTAEVALADVPVAAPSPTLRLARTGSMFELAVGLPDGWQTLSKFDAAGGVLAEAGVAMLVQAGGDNHPRVALFERVSFEQTSFPAEPDCTDVANAQPGQTVSILGNHLGGVSAVSIGGSAAKIVAKAKHKLMVEVPSQLETGRPFAIVVTDAGKNQRVNPPLFVRAAAGDANRAPAIDAVTDADGALKRTAREGDDVFLAGRDLPIGEGAMAWLGDAPAAILSDSTTERLHLRLGRVGKSQYGCPRLFAPRASDSGVRYGDTYSVSQSQAPRLCPMLEGASASDTTVSRTTPGVVLSVPRAAVGPGVLHVDVLWSSPASSGRGSRALSIALEPIAVGPTEDRYAKTLAALAVELSARLNGPATAGCKCDVLVTSDAPAGTLLLAPCEPVPAPDAKPVVPGLPVDLTPNHPQASVLSVAPPALPPPVEPECATLTPETDERAWSWCQFMAVVRELQTGPYAGYPTFESYVSLKRLLAVRGYPYDEAFVAPHDVPVADKTVVMEPGLATRLEKLGYAYECAVAARTYYCPEASFSSQWMPRFKTGDRMLKLFFVEESQLAPDMNKAALYSYVPPGGARQYLVGMHIAVARFFPPDGDDAYFYWITLWVPPAGTPPPNFNTACPLAHNSDKPAALQGSGWGSFVMCTEAGPDGTRCGNPWGPKNECTVEGGAAGCASCHAARGHVMGTHRIELGWLIGPAVQFGAGVGECINEIVAGEKDYSSRVDCARSDPQLAADPFLP